MRIGPVVVLALVSFRGVQGQNPIRLKAREIDPRMPVGAASAGPNTGGLRHYIVQFRSYPGPELRQELARRDIRVLAYVPEWALMVSGKAPLDLAGLEATWSGTLEASDKLSPALETEPAGAYLAIFHPDVDMEAARAMVRGLGFEILENPDLGAARLLVTGARDRLLSLADRDAVAYIIPATVDLAARRRVLWCPGPLTEAGPTAEYALVGTGWPKDSAGQVALQYFYQSLTTNVDADTARGEIARAFAEWAHYGNVSFAQAASAGESRSIDISFVTGAHGDAYPFTGTSVLAHTFYPVPNNPEPVAGDMHFNAAETWSVGSGVDVFSVALHEAGHALGLGHSAIPGAVMYPYYAPATGLTADDIAAVQTLYGPAGATPSPPTPPAQPTPAPPTPPVQPAPTQPAQPTPPSGGGGDTTPPSLQVLSPSLTIVATSAPSIAVSGTASDSGRVASVTWSTSNGDAGAAAGTAQWSATVPLLVGNNTVTIRAFDTAGNSAWRALTVVRR